MVNPREPRNFDEWRLLASSDPEGFEVARRKALEAVIARVPESRRHRLKAVQWRVDRIRERSASPLAACISLSKMMWDSLAGEHGLLEALQKGQDSAEQKSSRHCSAVIQLRKNGPGQG